jgi:hypothetical protein
MPGFGDYGKNGWPAPSGDPGEWITCPRCYHGVGVRGEWVFEVCPYCDEEQDQEGSEIVSLYKDSRPPHRE